MDTVVVWVRAGNLAGLVPVMALGAWISDAEVAEITYTALRVDPRSNHRPTRRAPGQGRPLS
jgi:hypothetical protein